MGMGLTTLGIVATLAFQTEHITVMKPGDAADIDGRTLTMQGIAPGRGPNFTETRAQFVFAKDGRTLGEVSSAKRFFTARQMPTTEAGLLTLGLGQLYVSLGDATTDGGMVVRVWWKPMVLLIWLGGVVMMLGAAVSLTDRRLRIGAPSRKARVAAAEIPG
jgi:cytochrome c-type biogenesis protein CcmF